MLMKHFWALPALLRPALVLASQHAFSVQDDILAFPQYQVKFSDDYVNEAQAESRLNIPESSNTEEESLSQLQHYQTQDGASGGANNQKEKPKLEYELLVMDGQRLLCSIPQVAKPSSSSSVNDTLSKAEEERELARANERGWELLSGMKGNCIYFISGWWSYRFCYNQGVRQFHQLPPTRGVPVYPPAEDSGVEGFMLGTYDSKRVEGGEAPKEQDRWEGEAALEISQHSKRRTGGQGELITRGESRYLVQRLEGGTVCDLTGKPRRIEVQFHCNPSTGNDRISLIKETSTCAYLMVVQTPRLCNDVAFLPVQKDHPNEIICKPVLAEHQIEDYQQNIADAKRALEEHNDWENEAEELAAELLGFTGPASSFESPIQIVGDIVVGGHSIVPKDVKIEKSAIVGGGKETYIDTIADSQGKKLSKEEIERLGLGDFKAVEKLRKELEKIAGESPWKLDVIDTPRGREYRGIIGEDEDEEEDQKQPEQTEEPQELDVKGMPVDKKEEDEQKGSEEEYYKEEL